MMSEMRRAIWLGILAVLLVCAGCSSDPGEPMQKNTSVYFLDIGQDMASQADDGPAGEDMDVSPADMVSEDLSDADVDLGDSPEDMTNMTDMGMLSSEARLKAWFADYNSGEGTSYLEEDYETLSGGDPRYEGADAHTFMRGVPYGPHARNELDAWLAQSQSPTPAVVFVHGGGFRKGDKETIHGASTAIPTFLSAGVSVVSISYRYAYSDPALALEATEPDAEGSDHNVNGARLDFILRDCARAVQFVRYRASDWNIDPDRIAIFGTSAGAGCSMWVGAVDDLADQAHEDPVLRESTRVAAVGHLTGQPTYNFSRWPALLDMSAEFLAGILDDEVQALTQSEPETLSTSAEGKELSWVLDYYEHMSPGDPPFYTSNSNDDVAEEMNPDLSMVLHHPRAHVALYRRCLELGLECEIETKIESSGYQGSIFKFLVEEITKP